MCGIAGHLGDGLDRNRARRMLDRLAHRGPDGSGEWHEDADGFPRVFLGHRRLAILDLSPGGAQPMVSASGRFVLTYNGEVYNYRDLRTELESQGHHFRSHSDTEVILTACEVWGAQKALPRFEGMFALGLYDRREKILLLARDPMGIKPLYYTQDGPNFAFASELQALREIPWLDTTIDPAALQAYVRYLCVPAPASIFKTVKKLPPGTLLRWDGRNTTLQTYWDLPAKAREGRANPLTGTLRDSANALEEKLRRSVRLHMQSDVPYGAFLSGGIDSSLVVALMQAQSPRPVKTFSIGFPDPAHDESAHARAVARHLGTDHHEMILDPQEALRLIPHVAGFYDEPFADGSAVPTFLVSRFARQHVTVALSGDGGDELFGGYPRYVWADRIERARRRLTAPGAGLSAALLQAVPDAVWDRILDPLTRGRLSGPHGLAARVHRLSAYLGTPRGEAYRRTMAAWPDPSEILSGPVSDTRLGADAATHTDLSWAQDMMLIDQGNYLPDDILTKVDRASMAVSLESRVPLLTHDLVEWSWRLPDHHKVSPTGDRGKLVLREVLDRYVPKNLIERPKQGFGMPMALWLRGPLRDWAESLLVSVDLEEAGLRPQSVAGIWTEHQAGQDHLAKLWTVLMLRQWQETNKTEARACAA